MIVEWYGLDAFLTAVIRPGEGFVLEVDFPAFLGVQSDVGAHNMQVMRRLRSSGVLTIDHELPILGTGRNDLYMVLYTCLFFDKFSEAERLEKLTALSLTMPIVLFFFRHSPVDKLVVIKLLIRTGLFMTHLSSVERSECFSHLQSLGVTVWTQVADALKSDISMSACYASLVLFSVAYPVLSNTDRVALFVHHFNGENGARKLGWFWSHFPGDLHAFFFN